jgi:hypothetical protein
MTDPASLAFGVIGTTAAINQIVTALWESLRAIHNAPDTIATIKEYLKNTLMILKELDTLDQTNLGYRISTVDVITPASDVFKEACLDFRIKIKAWTTYSTESKMFWLDKIKIASSGNKIDEFYRKTSVYNNTLGLALALENL